MDAVYRGSYACRKNASSESLYYLIFVLSYILFLFFLILFLCTCVRGACMYTRFCHARMDSLYCALCTHCMVVCSDTCCIGLKESFRSLCPLASSPASIAVGLYMCVYMCELLVCQQPLCGPGFGAHRHKWAQRVCPPDPVVAKIQVSK